MDRIAQTTRETAETQIKVSINIDGTGTAQLNSGIGFFDHMLEQIARHGLIDLDILTKGDLHIDNHHSVEDTGIALGQAFLQALGDKKGIHRYGHSYIPLDEALSRVVIDFSGRPGLSWDVNFTREKIGDMETETFYEFFNGFASAAKATVHIDNLKGLNNHHIIETIFKAFGKALRMACSFDERAGAVIPSTKGVL